MEVITLEVITLVDTNFGGYKLRWIKTLVDNNFGGCSRIRRTRWLNFLLFTVFMKRLPENLPLAQKNVKNLEVQTLVGTNFGGYKLWWIKTLVGNNFGGCSRFGG